MLEFVPKELTSYSCSATQFSVKSMKFCCYLAYFSRSDAGQTEDAIT